MSVLGSQVFGQALMDSCGLLPKFLRNFFLNFGHLSGRGGGLPDSKTFEELFFLRLDIFQENRGGGGFTCFQKLWGKF